MYELNTLNFKTGPVALYICNSCCVARTTSHLRHTTLVGLYILPCICCHTDIVSTNKYKPDDVLKLEALSVFTKPTLS